MKTYHEEHPIVPVFFQDLKVGDVFVEYPDCFMFGTRCIVESKTDEMIIAQMYALGKINVRASVMRRGEPYWTRRGETISDWAEKMFGVITT